MSLLIKVKKSFDNNAPFYQKRIPVLLPTSNAGFSNKWSPSCIPPVILVGLLSWAPRGGTCLIVYVWLCFCRLLGTQLKGLSLKNKLHSRYQTSLCMNYISKWSLPQAKHWTCWGSFADRKKPRTWKKQESFPWRQRHCSEYIFLSVCANQQSGLNEQDFKSYLT